MTIFRTFTDAEREALTLHGLDTDGPSQLSDAFVLGLRHAAAPSGPTLSDEDVAELVMANAISDHPTAQGLVRAVESAVLARVAAAPTMQAADGWKLVPVEPTEEMQGPSYMGPDGPKWPIRKEIYRAMVAACPHKEKPE